MPLNQPLPNSLTFDVVILGAGASGLMCALTAANRGRKVLIIDHANKIGKKILISGGGRCNYTNLYAEPSNYLSQNPHFVKSALSRYTQWDFQAIIDQYGIAWHERDHGQLFCDDSARDIVDALVEECRLADVAIRLKTSLNSVKANSNGFVLNTTLGTLKTRSFVVATGGLSFPTMGATGFGYELAQQFGHNLIPRTPALVPFTMNPEWMALFGELSGNSAKISMSCNGKNFTENVLFTHKGLSGPVTLQISSYWKPGQTITIDWLPALSLQDELLSAKQQQPNTQLKSILAQHLTKRLVNALLNHNALTAISQQGTQIMGQFNNEALNTIAHTLHHFVITPAGTEGYKKAEVTLGGVDTKEVSSKTLESQKQKGLYFIGEVLDVTGQLGGFNFQWAWASGHCAGLVV